MKLTLDQALQKGIEAHKAGKAQEADQYYTAILKANPKHPDANHNMGVLAVGVGKVQEALPFFKTALQANPRIAQFWRSYIDALIKLDQIADAKEVFDQAKSIGVQGDGFERLEGQLQSFPSQNSNTQEPSQEQLIEKAVELRENGKYDDAISLLKNNIVKFPADPNIQAVLSHCYILNEDLEKAKIHLDAAKNINPNIASVGWNETRLYLNQKKLNEALDVAKKTNKLFPDDTEGMVVLASCFRANGNFDESLKYLNKAIELNPNFAEALINRGLISLAQKDKVSSLSDLEKAYNLKPQIKQIWHLVLNLKMEVKDFKNTIALAEEMMRLDPVDEKIIATIALCYQNLKNYNQAIVFYNKALAIKPNNQAAWTNLGLALHKQDKLNEAIEAYSKALSIKPDCIENYYYLGNALERVAFNKPSRDLQNTIILILEKKSIVRPNNIFNAASSLLKFEQDLQKHLKLVDGHVIENPLEVISDLSKLSLLIKLMSICPLPDLELEKLLKNLRRALLVNILDIQDGSPELLSFQTALALQCFINEYIYSHTEEETKILQSLEARVKVNLDNNEQPNPQLVLALASYKALNQYDWCRSLAVTDHIQEVFNCQVEEPKHEEKLKKQLQALEEITDSVSSKVRAQYEENPYPRWVNIGLKLRPRSISEVIDQNKLKLCSHKITEVEKPNILIAGCGTGQHSIVTASTFKSSKVLAIDLSLSSLAYAKRKTDELAIKNLEYMQADILDLDQLNRQFDIIESIGVLHHMDNPMAGWKVLTDCLRPGGLMKIGLYSEVAREPIVKIRNEISEQGIGSTDIEMKSFRDTTISSNKDHHTFIRKDDFYSLSMLRDLLFHVQEQRFTIPQLNEHLDVLGLKFCGFDTKEIVAHFRQTNTKKDDLYDLDKWKAYEAANPRAFAGMYQFWCQKIE